MSDQPLLRIVKGEPTAEELAALTVVDCLYIAVAQRDHRRARKAVADSRKAVASHHIA